MVMVIRCQKLLFQNKILRLTILLEDILIVEFTVFDTQNAPLSKHANETSRTF
jgi:hypothetical protein